MSNDRTKMPCVPPNFVASFVAKVLFQGMKPCQEYQRHSSNVEKLATNQYPCVSPNVVASLVAKLLFQGMEPCPTN